MVQPLLFQANMLAPAFWYDNGIADRRRSPEMHGTVAMPVVLSGDGRAKEIHAE
jgi:hypothetical protein